MSKIFSTTKCNNVTCKFNRNAPALSNNCEALREVYQDSSKCPFFKKKEDDNHIFKK